MTFQPGQSGNPKGYSGPRNRRRHEVFQIIKDLGHKFALVTLSTLAHESQDEGIKMAAAAALAPYCHPKLQATPTPRFVENPIDVADFVRVSDAESFLARLPVLVARGELDFQSAQELCAMTKLWIDSQNARSELELKKITVDGPGDQVIRIEGGLSALPGPTTARRPTATLSPPPSLLCRRLNPVHPSQKPRARNRCENTPPELCQFRIVPQFWAQIPNMRNC